MAFLKDHKVENHVIFPAAAFVEMALEAGVQLFEGQPFVVEDFEIRKPLILPDPPSGVQLEFSYSPNERTFAIQSRFEQSVTWSLHVVGSLRGERTESAFASSKWEQPSGHSIRRGRRLLPAHERSGLALWRGISAHSRISRPAPGDRQGAWLLSDAICSPRGRICAAPGALRRSASGFLRRRGDGRRSAGADEVAGRVFARILFLGSPGASSRVCAKVREFSDDFLEGDIALYDEGGKPCVLVDGFRAISLSGAGRSAAPGGTRDLTYHVAWQRTPYDVA